MTHAVLHDGSTVNQATRDPAAPATPAAPPRVEGIANAWAVSGTWEPGQGAAQPRMGFTVSGGSARPADAAWTTSIGALLGDMALDEARRLGTADGAPHDRSRRLHRWRVPLVRAAAVLGARTVRPVTHALDPVLMLNSAGLSTQLHAPAVAGALAGAGDAAFEALSRAHGGATIVMRSLDARQSAGLLAWARAAGWTLLPMRRVWYQAATTPALWARRNVKHDQALAREVLARPGMHWRPLTVADAPAAAALYAQLYLGKYSRHNPHFTSAWFREALASGWLSGELLAHHGTPLAVLAGWRSHGYQTYPVFGYDLQAPADLGLYRLLSLRALERARAAGDLLHASAGADAFKASRGGEPELEWMAVRTAPLPAWRRAVWRGVAEAAALAARHVFPEPQEVAR